MVGLARGGIYGEIVSQALPPDAIWVLFLPPSFSQCIDVTQLAFEFSSKEIIPYVTVNLLCP